MGTGLITACRSERQHGSAPYSGAAFQPLRLSQTRGDPALRRRTRLRSFDIKAAGSQVRTGTLSGGNLQKALLARELAWNPTGAAGRPADPRAGCRRGRVRASAVPGAARPGAPLLVISEDLEELFCSVDRIAVMFEGRIMAVCPWRRRQSQQVGLLMAGVAGGGMIGFRLELGSTRPCG